MYIATYLIFTESEQDIQKNANALLKKTLKINIEKSRVMEIGKTKHNINIVLEGKSLEQVKNVKYLREMLNNGETQEIEIRNRMEGATQIYHCIKNIFIDRKKISRKITMCVYIKLCTHIQVQKQDPDGENEESTAGHRNKIFTMNVVCNKIKQNQKQVCEKKI